MTERIGSCAKQAVALYARSVGECGKIPAAPFFFRHSSPEPQNSRFAIANFVDAQLVARPAEQPYAMPARADFFVRPRYFAGRGKSSDEAIFLRRRNELGDVPPAGKGPSALCTPLLLPPDIRGGAE